MAGAVEGGPGLLLLEMHRVAAGWADVLGRMERLLLEAAHVDDVSFVALEHGVRWEEVVHAEAALADIDPRERC